MLVETTLGAERIESVLKQICRNLKKSPAKKIMKAFEDDPDSSFERVLDDALDLYHRRLANARKTVEQQHTKVSSPMQYLTLSCTFSELVMDPKLLNT